MTRRVHLQLSAITSDDGTRCAAECPHLSSSWCECTSFRAVVMRHEGGYLRAAACIAAEQAAVSVPSCDLTDDIDTVFWRFNADTPQQLAAFNRLVAAAVRSESGNHLDGGARALDASEALREARVQGMREALAAMRTILKEDVWGTPYIDLDDAEEALDAAIEAVRKGER